MPDDELDDDVDDGPLDAADAAVAAAAARWDFFSLPIDCSNRDEASASLRALDVSFSLRF